MDRFAKLVSGRLKIAPAGIHPGLDLLTALGEGSLAGGDREHLLRHLGTCSDCREILYLAMPDSAQVQHFVPPRPDRPRFVLRWEAVAASATILVLFTAHYSGRKAVTAPPASQVAAANMPAELDRLRAAGTSAQASRSRRQLQPQNQAPSRPPGKHMTVKPEANLDFDQSGEIRVGAPPVSVKPDGLKADSRDLSVSGKAAIPSIVGRGDQLTEGSAAKAVAVPAASQSPSFERPPAAALEMKRSEPAEKQAADSAYTPPVPTAISAVMPQWELSPQGAILRSLDSGKTWQPVSVSRGAVFRALSVLGPEIWLGGSAGILFRSADSGSTWVRIEPSAAGHKLQTDIIHIDLLNVQNSRLSTSNGEVWSTSDGGFTWSSK